ncbi:MAG: 1-deoxy-D-xylulose-5-phosphate reductoisomerase [Coriobacteriia bacterium]|nr:1-deoxy-D-xylulose-5-phosphate reductoisomerase [Coriobacteriia bacterium]
MACEAKPPRKVAVLGSTGSIGTQTLDVARRHPDKVQIVALAAGRRADELLEQAREFGVSRIALGNPDFASASTLAALEAQGSELFSVGEQAMLELIKFGEVDVVVNSLVGAAGLRVSYETLKAGKVLALANKESLVVGGDLIMPMARALDEASGFKHFLMPIDSEHGAIYQCLIGEDEREVSKLWVTASGGPFRGKHAADLANVTPEQALAHPTWNMGAKITIDSSTLMNKGLEVIEAHHLFNMPYEKIEVVVQPQSAIHSMVEFSDGSVKAHLGTTDMRIPIQYALSYPERWDAPVEPLDFRKLGSLDFDAPDTDTFKCLALARHAGMVGGTLPCAMNAANEIAVAAFLKKKLSYLGIAETVQKVMQLHEADGVQAVESIDQLLEVDAWAREAAADVVESGVFAYCAGEPASAPELR